MIQLQKALDAVLAFSRETSYYKLLETILSKMMELTSADAGTLYVVENEHLVFRILKTVSLNIYRGANEKINLPPVKLDSGNIENISAYAALNNELVNVQDVYKDVRFNFTGPKNYDTLTGYKTQSMLVFPLSTTEGDVVGVIQLINAMDGENIVSFDEVYDTDILTAIAGMSANALANILYAKEIDDLFHSFARVLTQAIDERSAYNANHTNSVARLCGQFADYLSAKFAKGHNYHFTENRKSQLVMAAYMHDIGKIITPLNIMDKMDRLGKQREFLQYKFDIKYVQIENDFLAGRITQAEYQQEKDALGQAWELVEAVNKSGFVDDEKIKQIHALAAITYKDRDGNTTPIFTEYNLQSLAVRKGTLTDSEREIMQEHVSITYRLLQNMNFNKAYKDVPRWASSHHEFLDGSGYPLGLRGDEVTVEMCILTITDIYDSLTADDRPYKSAMPPEKALGILREMVKEGKLHGQLVELFVNFRESMGV
ncbi:MAG: HD domain-containing protein [Defluviitaleaceae bacterium]|nr:HD domain-containing protein [Defluviitaleaceae bacterium]